MVFKMEVQEDPKNSPLPMHTRIDANVKSDSSKEQLRATKYLCTMKRQGPHREGYKR